MKRIAMFMFLFLSAFVISSFGSVRNADALGNYGCFTEGGDRDTHVACLKGLLERTPLGADQSAVSAACPTMQINCLRGLLDTDGTTLQVDDPRAQSMDARGQVTGSSFDDQLMSTPGGGRIPGGPCTEVVTGDACNPGVYTGRRP
jgi:hypothetical protein